MKSNWVEPWSAVDSASSAQLAHELALEIGPKHVLQGMPVTVIARHSRCDDILVQLADGSGRVAVVHLTFRGGREPEPYPITTTYESLEAWALQAAIDQEIEICNYDPRWSVEFESERNRLMTLFPGAFLTIEHVGSTAVPGLAAKPVVDLVAVIDSMDAAESLVDALCANGYSTSAEFNATLKDRKWLMRYGLGGRTHHLHLVPAGSADLADKLRFRDLLRSDADLSAKYLELKESLASSLGHDREKYTEAKTEFIRTALAGE